MRKSKVLGVLLASVALIASVWSVPTISEKMGDLEFQYTAEDGARVSAYGVPVINGSRLFIIWPRWAGVFYDPSFKKDIIETAKIERSADKVIIKIYHQTAKDNKWPISGVETFTLTKDNVYSNDLEFTFSNPTQAAFFDWNPGMFYSTPFAGKPYTITYPDGKKVSGVYALGAGETGVSSSDAVMGRKFKSVQWETTFGPVEMVMDTTPEEGFHWLDYRRVDWVLPGAAPMFWMGFLGEKVVNGKQHHYGLTLNFPKTTDKIAKTSAGMTFTPTVNAIGDARIPHCDPSIIIPQPKSLKWGKGGYPLSKTTKIYVGKNPSPALLNAVQFFTDELQKNYKVTPVVVKQTAGSKDAGIDLNAKLKLPVHPEGYSLSVTPKMVQVSAHSDQGIFYALSSLIQMVKVDEKGVSLKSGRINDYPALDFRGIHMYTGKNRGDEQSKAVRDLQARFKTNSLLWSCEYIKWDRHPELHNPNIGMDKADAQKVLDTGEKYFIDVIPCIAALGQSRWLFQTGAHLDICEDTTRKDSYCADNPKSYELLFDIYDEAMGMFDSKYFHIAECEINVQGNPICAHIEKRTGKDPWEVMVDDQNYIAEWLGKRGKTPMLWGDMFVSVGDAPDATNARDTAIAKWARENLSDNYIVNAWHYGIGAPESFKSLGLFKEAGKKAIGCTWYLPANIRNFTLAAVSTKSMGMLQTTWAGFDMKITDDPKNWMQYWAYLWADHYFWSGDTTLPEDLPFDAPQLFVDTWFGKQPVLNPKSGFMVDLSPVYNRPLVDTKTGSGWIGFGNSLDLSGFPKGQLILEETRFNVKPNGKGDSAVMLAGRMNPSGKYPTSVTLDVKNQQASEIHFLMTSGFRENDNTLTGNIVVKYTDGTSHTLPLIYGKNAWAFNDTRITNTKESLTNGRVAWKKKTPSGEYVSVRDIIWTNPSPTKTIQSIVVESANTVACPIVLAVTGVK